ncbi:hypothetical protein [Mucilaginibacter rubeus]|uniref:Uncharacterized protein n=1 Tax=Mucilaginibacter rubeus TaxID=2027860 RepID=A0A5C1HVM9_9SPHI|nr:hypothetical protein [Mucilaginibacter rubeus]QEM09121.1 hypothetical protein DEO27_003510 [Mucilaginibacter rubeus]
MIYKAGANNNSISNEELTDLLLSHKTSIDFTTGKISWDVQTGAFNRTTGDFVLLLTTHTKSFDAGGNRYLNGLADGNGAVDAFMGAMASKGGLTRVGSNTSVYFERPNGFVFRGNQYTTTYSIAKTGAEISRYTSRFGYALGAAQIGYGYYEDGWAYGNHTRVAMGSVGGGIIGGWVGAEIGATGGAGLGAGIGAFFFGVGAAPGAAIGGIIGGFVGGFGGGWAGGELGGSIVKRHYGLK